MNFIKRIYRKIRRILHPNEKLTPELVLERKKREDYEFLLASGVETELGYVTLLGKPIIHKAPHSKIKIGPNVILASESQFNVAGINHPCILATLAEGAEIDIAEGVGMSGTSVCCVEKISIGKNTLCGVNTNIWDTDFHCLDAALRKAQKEPLQAAHGAIAIGDDVWLGANVTVLKNVKIGKNTIIGASSLVNRDIPSCVIAAGNPAQVTKTIEK